MILLFFLFWIILNGRITLEILLFGAAVSVLIYLFASRMLQYNARMETLIIRNLPLFLLYIPVLVLEIVKAAFSVGRIALDPGKKPDPCIVEFHSGLPLELQNVLLANSITLTPGTYTLFQRGDHFRVHCLLPEYGEGLENLSFVRILRSVRIPGEPETGKKSGAGR